MDLVLSKQRRKQTPQRFVPCTGPSCLQRYSPVKRIEWSGDLGETCEASDYYSPGRRVLLKDVPVDKHRFKEVESGLRKHSQLTHPHLVELLEAEAGFRMVKLVIEYPREGSLLEYVRSQKGPGLDENLARWLFQQVVTAVEYCHSLGQPLGNLRAENVLLSKGVWLPVVKVWGVVYAPQGNSRSKEDLLQYRAPESMWSGSGAATCAMDAWGLGVLLHFMVSARYPMSVEVKGSNDYQAAYYKQSMAQGRGLRQELGMEGVSPACSDLIDRCLQASPNQRIKIQGVFEHEWFKVNFPLEAREMNARLLEMNHMGSSLKSTGDISNIVLDACCKHAGDTSNRFIDQIIMQESGRESKLANKSSRVAPNNLPPARLSSTSNQEPDAGA